MLRTFSTFFSRPTLVALTAVLICGCGRKPPAPPPPTVVVPHQIAGLKSYQEGLAALGADDQEQAQRLLLDAVHQNTNLTEAWYELGHLKVTMAQGLFKTDELRALVLFREGMQFEQQALKLLDEDKITVWKPADVEQAREKMELDLRDADRALADEDSLREALRTRIY